jgi:hypothetical protein
MAAGGSKMSRETNVRDVQQRFEKPMRVARDGALSVAQKIEILENWRLDLVELLTATGENMPSDHPGSGDAAEQLREVCAALDAVRQTEPGSGAA